MGKKGRKEESGLWGNYHLELFVRITLSFPGYYIFPLWWPDRQTFKEMVLDKMRYIFMYTLIFSLYYADTIQFKEQGKYSFNYFGHRNCVPGNANEKS